MGDSLQDQLRALGLGKKRRQKKEPAELSLEKAYALKRREEQKQADMARRRKQAEDRQRRLLNNRIRDIVKAGRLNREDAEIARNFLFRGRIRKIQVTREQLTELNAGKLGIVYLSGGYHLLGLAQIEEVRALSAEHVVDLNTGDSDDDEEFPVPDDLSW